MQDDLGEGDQDDNHEDGEKREGTCHVPRNQQALKYKTTQSDIGTHLEVLFAKSGLNI